MKSTIHTGVDLTGVTVKANGTVTQSASYTYNNNHNLTSATGIDGVKTSYTYNSKGLPTSITVSDASEQNITSTSYEYTSDNNYLKSVTDAAGSTTQYEYNTAKGLVTKIIDPNGNETVYEYDPNNDLLISVSNPSSTVGNPTTEFEYNLSGQLMQISNVDIEYNLNYNSFGESIGVNLFDSPLSSNSYNNENQLSDTIFGNGNSVEYSYNEDNLLSKVEYNGELSYEYFYTSQNQVGRLVDHDNGVTWEYFYDMAGRLTDVESDNGKKIEYTYDSKNNPDSLIVKDGSSNLTNIDYAYDSLNRPSAVTVNSMTGQPSQSYVYDSLGRITGYENTTDGANPQNKITRSFSYLTNGGLQTNRIGSVSYTKTTSEGTSPYVAGYSYEYGANGNITHIYYNGELQNQYYYDSLNRLAREDRVSYNKTFVYNYDNCGDILSKSEYKYTSSTTLGTPTKTITYEYGDADNPNGLTSYNGKSITYDANGNPLTYRGYTMTWEKGRQLASMSKGGITTTFKYDASGIRTEKAQGNYKTEYTYVGEKLVLMKAGSTIMNFAYGADGSPYSFTYNGTVYFYLLNLQGDVIGIYDASGNIIVRYTYDAWGKLITLNGSNGTIGLSNPLRYRGYVYDTDTELYYLQSRYYDPETGRFINADSLLIAGNDFIQGTNMYAYCYNNPVMYSDPTGYMTTEDVIYFSVGVVCCLILLAGRVPDEVAASYMSSLAKYFEYDFEEVKERLDLLLSSFPTNENWPSDLPYPTEFDESGFTVVADVRFTDEGFCMAYANRIIAQFGNGYTYQGMGSVRIAVELYAHAVAHFMLPELKKTFLYDAFKDDIDSMHKSSNPITVNNDDKRVAFFYAAWAIF